MSITKHDLEALANLYKKNKNIQLINQAVLKKFSNSSTSLKKKLGLFLVKNSLIHLEENKWIEGVLNFSNKPKTNDNNYKKHHKSIRIQKLITDLKKVGKSEARIKQAVNALLKFDPCSC